MADDEKVEPIFNPYEVLGVMVDDDEDAIKRAYRHKARITHPDMQGGDRDKYEEVVKAYKVLMDPDMRSRFDKSGTVDKMSTEAIFGAAINEIAKYWIQVIDVCLKQKADPAAQDLVKIAIDHFKKNVIEIRNGQNEARNMAVQFERTIKRLKRKDQGESFVHRALNEQLKQYWRMVENSEQVIDIVDQVLVILRDYQFEPDRVQRIMSDWTVTAGNSFFNTGTAT